MKIGLQNFQSIGAYTEIELSPLTLFYGPNSAGKSIFVDALDLIKKWGDKPYIPENMIRNNMKEVPLADSFLGEPEDVVISIEGTFSDNNFFEVGDNLNDTEFFKKNPDTDFSILYYEFFSIDKETSFGRSYRLVLFFNTDHQKDGYPYAWILYFDEVPVLSRGYSIVYFNILHKNFPTINKQLSVDYLQLVESSYKSTFEITFNDRKITSKWARSFFFTKRGTQNEVKNILRKTRFPIEMIGFELLNEFDDYIRTTTDEIFKNRENEINIIHLNEIVSLIYKLAVKGTALKLSSVPPIRSIPPKIEKTDSHLWERINILFKYRKIDEINQKYKRQSINEFSREAFNQSAFLNITQRLIDNVPREEQAEFLISLVNYYLYDKDFLNAGYQLSCDYKLNIPITEEVSFGDCLSSYVEFLSVDALFLFDHKKRRIAFENVGVGVSQIIPVLALMTLFGTFSFSKNHVLHIQQPELHLHPKLQCALGDIFIHALNTFGVTKKTDNKILEFLVVETHSEHLLLRLLRRIRETSASDNSIDNVKTIIKHKQLEFQSEDLSVVYVHRDENNLSIIKQLRINKKGDFIDRWPNGFFSERDLELFSDGF